MNLTKRDQHLLYPLLQAGVMVAVAKVVVVVSEVTVVGVALVIVVHQVQIEINCIVLIVGVLAILEAPVEVQSVDHLGSTRYLQLSPLVRKIILGRMQEAREMNVNDETQPLRREIQASSQYLQALEGRGSLHLTSVACYFAIDTSNMASASSSSTPSWVITDVP